MLTRLGILEAFGSWVDIESLEKFGFGLFQYRLPTLQFVMRLACA